MLKIRRSHNRLIFNMGIPIPGKDGLYIKTGPSILLISPCVKGYILFLSSICILAMPVQRGLFVCRHVALISEGPAVMPGDRGHQQGAQGGTCDQNWSHKSYLESQHIIYMYIILYIYIRTPPKLHSPQIVRSLMLMINKVFIINLTKGIFKE